jgi:L-lactate dehydrogenase complex protein LldG
VSGRERILGRVREALQAREAAPPPGDFEGWRPESAVGTPVDQLASMLEAAGAEVLRHPTPMDAGKWLRRFALDFESCTIGVTVPHQLRPAAISTRGAHEAALAVSMARAAIAETGSLLMDARDGRKTQLLAPTHIVFVHAGQVHATFREALQAVRDDLPSAIGLHSGPSKSADIAQTLVTGVHGPGRLIAVVIEDEG